MALSLVSFLALLALGGVIAVAFPLWWLILLDMATPYVFGVWSLGPLLVAPTDLIVGLLVAGLLLRGRIRPESKREKIVFLGPWLLLVLLYMASYLVAPINQPNLTDPVRITYQLIRYCVNPLIYLPLGILLLRSPKRAYVLLFVVVLAVDYCSLLVIQQGYAGVSGAPGPFRTKNQMGGVLVIPTLIAFAGCILPRTWPHFFFSGVSFVLMMRALLFTGSRGALAAVLLEMALLGLLLPTRPIGRKRARTLAPLVILGIVAILPFIPWLMSRPTFARAATVAEGGSDHNMQWRMQERWPHFWNIAVNNPLLGIGTAVDTSLGEVMPTPHNGFLSILVKNGFPAFFLIIFFALRAVRNGLRLYWRTPNPDHGAFGLTVAVSVLGILAHQMIEVTLTQQFTFNLFWLLVGTSELAKRWYDDDDEALVGSKEVARVDGIEPARAPAAR